MSRVPLQEGSINIQSPQKHQLKSPSKPLARQPQTTSSLALETQPTRYSSRRAASMKQDSKQDLPGQSSTTNTNVYLAKRKSLRQSLSTTVIKDHHHNQQPQQAQPKQTQQEREQQENDHKEWIYQWRQLMTEAHFFFEDIDEHSIDKVKPSLTKLEAVIEPFFGRSVNYVITKRPIDPLNPTDLQYKAQQRGLKIWTYEKLIRFLTNLLGYSPKNIVSVQPSTYKLSHMLRDEKLLGPNDRDPDTKREDYHYFKGPYLMIWDPKWVYRPLLMKEYPAVDDPQEGEWPRLRTSAAGRCPFLEDSHQTSAERQAYMEHMYQKKAERERKRKAALLDETEDTVKKVLITSHTHTSENKQIPQEKQSVVHVTVENTDTQTLSQEEATPGGTENSEETNKRSTTSDQSAQTEGGSGKFPARSGIIHRTSRFQEIVASGVNMSAATSAARSVTALSGGEPGPGNGLNLVRAQVPSRDVTNLKRKVLDREATVARMSAPYTVPTTTTNASAAASTISTAHAGSVAAPVATATTKKKDNQNNKGGFCENCHEQFETFDEHIASKKHRKYANNPQNFQALDELLFSLQRPLKNAIF